MFPDDLINLLSFSFVLILKAELNSSGSLKILLNTDSCQEFARHILIRIVQFI